MTSDTQLVAPKAGPGFQFSDDLLPPPWSYYRDWALLSPPFTPKPPLLPFPSLQLPLSCQMLKDAELGSTK